jgi:hypothetical protein
VLLGARRLRRFTVTGAFAAACGLSAFDARADGPLGPKGAPIRTSSYTVDLFQGPVLATTRILGLAGAFQPIAEGAAGIPVNPASVSVRPSYSTTPDDWDLDAGLTFPSSVRGTDFDNNGSVGFRYRDFYWGNFAAYVQHDRFAIGASLTGQTWSLGAPPVPSLVPGTEESVRSFVVRIFRGDLVASGAFMDEQVHVGGGFRVVSFWGVGVTSGGSERSLFNTNGVGLQGGVLWTPWKLPLRLGGTVRTPVLGAVDESSRVTANAQGDLVFGEFYLPKQIDLPWEIEWGAAMQFGPRALNKRWRSEDERTGPEVERERRTTSSGREATSRAARRILEREDAARPRQKLLVTTTALLSGPVTNAVGFESMLERVVERSGQRATLTLRGGAEAEVIPGWLQVRAGTYMEPTRFRGADARLHGTLGFESKLFEWTVFGLYHEGTAWRLSGAVDASRDYFGWSVGAGLWR